VKSARSIRNDRLPENLTVRTGEIFPEIVQANPEDWRSCGFKEKTSAKKTAYFHLHRILRMEFALVENPLSPPNTPSWEAASGAPGLLTKTLSNKYLDRLPFERQNILKKQRSGIDLSPNTMDAAANIANPYRVHVRRMKQRILARRYVRSDEIFIRDLDKTSMVETPMDTYGFTGSLPETSSSTGRPAASTSTPSSGSDPTMRASFRVTTTKPTKAIAASCKPKTEPSIAPPASPASDVSLKTPAQSYRKGST
jgi:hypothetical protein